MSSDFDPLQACPKPVQTPYRPLVAVEPSFARLVTLPRQPLWPPQDHLAARRAARTPSARPLINYECLIRQTRRRQQE